eukprot:757059-Hanusia_phi.AAC.4
MEKERCKVEKDRKGEQERWKVVKKRNRKSGSLLGAGRDEKQGGRRQRKNPILLYQKYHPHQMAQIDDCGRVVCGGVEEAGVCKPHESGRGPREISCAVERWGHSRSRGGRVVPPWLFRKNTRRGGVMLRYAWVMGFWCGDEGNYRDSVGRSKGGWCSPGVCERR